MLKVAYLQKTDAYTNSMPSSQTTEVGPQLYSYIGMTLNIQAYIALYTYMV